MSAHALNIQAPSDSTARLLGAALPDIQMFVYRVRHPNHERTCILPNPESQPSRNRSLIGHIACEEESLRIRCLAETCNGLSNSHECTCSVDPELLLKYIGRNVERFYRLREVVCACWNCRSILTPLQNRAGGVSSLYTTTSGSPQVDLTSLNTFTTSSGTDKSHFNARVVLLESLTCADLDEKATR